MIYQLDYEIRFSHKSFSKKINNKEKQMKNHFEKLREQHRKLNRMIDSSKSFGKQEEVKQLKRLRLGIKDRLTQMKNSRVAQAA